MQGLQIRFLIGPCDSRFARLTLFLDFSNAVGNIGEAADETLEAALAPFVSRHLPPLDRYLTTLPAMSLIPIRSIETRSLPIAPTLVALPSMSLIPSAPF